MWNQDRRADSTDTSLRTDPGDPAEPRAASGSDDVAPIRETVRPWALEVVVAAYGGDTHRLLTDLAEVLEASIASDALLLTPEEAASALRVGRTTVFARMKAGELRPVHIGRSCRLSRAELERYVSHLQTPPPPPPCRAHHRRRPTTTNQGELFDLVHTEPEKA